MKLEAQDTEEMVSSSVCHSPRATSPDGKALASPVLGQSNPWGLSYFPLSTALLGQEPASASSGLLLGSPASPLPTDSLHSPGLLGSRGKYGNTW